MSRDSRARSGAGIHTAIAQLNTNGDVRFHGKPPSRTARRKFKIVRLTTVVGRGDKAYLTHPDLAEPLFLWLVFDAARDEYGQVFDAIEIYVSIDERPGWRACVIEATP